VDRRCLISASFQLFQFGNSAAVGRPDFHLLPARNALPDDVDNEFFQPRRPQLQAGE
jgi:hypothetical protein